MAQTLDSNPHITVFAGCCDWVSVEKKGRCSSGWRREHGCSWNSTVAASVFLSSGLPNEGNVHERWVSVCISGLELPHQSFRVASHREIARSNQVSHPMLKRHMSNLRAEALNFCGVYARDRIQQYMQNGTSTIVTNLHKNIHVE